jgi:hypothetical protein
MAGDEDIDELAETFKAPSNPKREKAGDHRGRSLLVKFSCGKSVYPLS